MAEHYGAVSYSKFFDDEGEILDEKAKDIFAERLKGQIKQYYQIKEFIDYIVPIYENNKTILEKHQQVIIDKIGDVEVVIQNNHSETTKMLQTLFLTSYSGLDKDKQFKLIKEYENEIQKIINDDDKFQKLTKTNRWEDFKEAFAEIGKSGGVETFTNTTVDMLKEAGIFDFPGGKILSIGIKGIVSLASK